MSWMQTPLRRAAWIAALCLAPLAAGAADVAASAAAAPAAIVAPAWSALSETLNLIRRRGSLVVGVKSDYPPFGSLDATGELKGFEHDMAADLARRLGVRLSLAPVTGANRLQKLEEGAVDVVIATMGDTAERRTIATIVEPSYYASGVTLFMRPEERVTEWHELRGKTVCATQGSFFNRSMSQRYLLNLLMFNNARDARLAVRDGRCVGYLFDDTAIWADLQRPEWAGYKAPLASAMVVPWSVALSRKEAGSELEVMVGDALADWHRSGFLLEREKAWGLPPSEFLARLHALWERRGADGQLLCVRDAHGAWPPACRNRVFLTPHDVGGLHQFGLTIKELTGWNLSYFYDDYDRGRYLAGLGWTVLLMLACVAGSLLGGVAGALIAESRLRLLGPLARGLAVWGRMTPPLLQMYMVFFGLGAVLWDSRGISLSAWAIAVWCLSYYTGSSVMTALIDAADLRRESVPGFRLRFRAVPLVYGHAAGSITASLVNVCKATMMASVIAVPELLAGATSILVDSGNVAEVMNMLLVTFLVLITVSIRLLGRLERWLRGLAEARA
ncbi:MAG TPA: transporter substrate-binding domain-containing protein [Ramlibacter sp.]|nr:transporter substrate-binding domain-containing protein [Ramlibacter sp.]